MYLGNHSLSANEFWLLLKSDEQSKIELLQSLIFMTFEISRVSSLLLTSFCPGLASQVLALLRQDSSRNLKIDLSKTYEVDLNFKVFVAKVE